MPTPTSPELAPEQHHLNEDFERIKPLAHATIMTDASPPSPQQHSPDPTSPEPPSKLCQTAPPCLNDLFDELPPDIPGLLEDPLPPVNTLLSSPQILHEPVLLEPPHKQQRTRAPSLSPSDDDEISYMPVRTHNTPLPADWALKSKSAKKNWMKAHKKP